MKKAAIYIAILAVSCAGLGTAAGVAMEKRYTAKHLPQIVRSHFAREYRPFGRGQADRHPQRKGRKSKNASRKGPGILGRLSKQLDLSEEQQQQIKTILEQARQNAKETSKAFKNRLRQIKKESSSEISSLLSPEQKEKFEELSAQAQRKRQERQKKHKRHRGVEERQ
ncbi:MAG: hypothetical protein U9Q08_01970 [Candidatus Omnitrophota bacterium]|nr:hypothetical protein [Candidatus Omnitrophota bacterium]